MMPNGWKEVKLGEIFDFRNGINADKSQYGQGVKFVNVMDVFGNHILTESKIIGRISISDKKLDDNRLEYGDVLFNRTSETFDEIAMSAVYLDNADATFGGFVIRGRPLTNKLDPRYTVYAFQDSNFRKQVIKLGQGAIRANIGQKDLVKVKLLVPPLQEQQKIAKILSTWDKAISTTECLIDNSTQQKKALMQQLLTGKKRLLDDEGKRFEGEWEQVSLSAVVKVTGGNAFKSTDFKEKGIPLIKISNIKSDYSVSVESSVFISLDQKYDKFQIKNGDVLIAMSGATTGKIGKYNFDEIAYLNQRVGRFDITEGLTTKSYLFQLLKIPKVQHEILIDAVGGAQPNISNKDIERIKVSIPPLKEQQKIATVLTNADKEIELLEQQLADLQQEKKALMQVLLTGKKRVLV